MCGLNVKLTLETNLTVHTSSPLEFPDNFDQPTALEFPIPSQALQILLEN